MTWQHLINSRLLALVCILFLVFVLTACGGGGGGPGGGRSPEPIADTCDATSTLVDGVCQPFAVRLDERATTPFVEDGTAVSLEVVLFKPLTGVRFPTVVFHHGSTGNGSDPALFGLTFTSKAITQYFVERGWMVAFPQRRGRGRSDGLYDEGFQPDRSAYSCRAVLTLVGAERALDDLDANRVAAHARRRGYNAHAGRRDITGRHPLRGSRGASTGRVSRRHQLRRRLAR
jgi:hypothetical protein